MSTISILSILNTIANESSTNKKVEILSKHTNNVTLKSVLYLAMSKRIKFYIKAIPESFEVKPWETGITLGTALKMLEDVYTRKVTGNSAIRHTVEIMSQLEKDDSEVIYRIIQKDLKIGMGRTQVNKVFPKLIEKTPYMGAVPYNKQDVTNLIEKNECVSQTKMDGRYCNAIIRGGEIELESRSGEETFIYTATFANELKGFPDIVLNGELTLDNTPRYESNGIIASIDSIEEKKKLGKDVTKEMEKFISKHGDYETHKQNIIFTVWDCITVEEYFNSSSNRTYKERFEKLNRMVEQVSVTNIRVIDSRPVKSYTEAWEHYLGLVSKGEEGTIVKALNGKWKDGKPKFQIKIKREEYYDLIIVGFNYGTKGTKNENVISSVVVESSDGKIHAVGAGMSEELMEDITANQDKYLGMIAEIKCSGLSHDSQMNYSLLHPVFIKVRNDKTEAHSFDECLIINNANNG